MTQDRHLLTLFPLLPCDPHDFIIDVKEVGLFDTSRCKELEEFLRIGNHLRLWSVVRFRQFAPERDETIWPAHLNAFFWMTVLSSSMPSVSRKYWNYLSSSSDPCTQLGYPLASAFSLRNVSMYLTKCLLSPVFV